MVLIDTNVLLDIATRDPNWFDWSSKQLSKIIKAKKAAINPIIYAELAPQFHNERELDLRLLPQHLFKRLPLPYAAAFPAARAYMQYRKTDGKRTSPLPDFFIGAHAEADGLKLLTRDPARYLTYFPQIELIYPT